MNRAIARFFLLLVGLFALLVAFTSRWSVIEAESLEDNIANRRPLLEQQKVPRGLITARDGTVLAQSRRQGRGKAAIYVRDYPQGRLFSHAVGYSFVQRGSAGLEKSANEVLSGEGDELTNLLDEIGGRGARRGDDIRTTLDPNAQRVALEALGGRDGAIVALEPETGRVRVMASLPDFDPNDIPERFGQLNRDEDAPLFNRVTQSRYPPGSTMKVVSAVAAIDSGRYRPDSIVDGSNDKPVSGVPLQNFGGADYGPVTLTEALTRSINTVWGEVAERLGKETYYRYMRQFGFNRDPPLDYPPETLEASGVFGRRGLLDADDPVDIGRVAIGQERLQVTPLQMAMVAAAVANDGRLMKPRLIERVTAPDGRVRTRVNPDQYQRVMTPQAARAVGAMMAQVVEEGSGTAAALKNIRVAGKTGTAEVDNGASNQAWFIAFAPVDDPKMAIAVTIQRTQGTGGEEAAPIAARVLEALVGDAVAESGATSPQEMGRVMSLVMPRVDGRADGRRVSAIVREKLTPA